MMAKFLGWFLDSRHAERVCLAAGALGTAVAVWWTWPPW